MNSLKTTARIGASWLALAGAALAQQSPAPADARETRIRELEARVAEIESELQQLREQEAARPVQAQAPASTPQQTQPTISVANGRPTIASANGDFRFAVRGLAQFDAAGYMQDNPATTDNRRGD